MLITLTHQNYQQIAFKLQNQLELKNNSSPDRAKNMIKLKDNKLAESASLVIKSPIVAIQSNKAVANAQESPPQKKGVPVLDHTSKEP